MRVHCAGGTAGSVQVRLTLFPPSFGVSSARSGKADAEMGAAAARRSAAVATVRASANRMEAFRRGLLVRTGQAYGERDDETSRADDASKASCYRPMTAR
jgi:hypothetical protein